VHGFALVLAAHTRCEVAHSALNAVVDVLLVVLHEVKDCKQPTQHDGVQYGAK